MLAALLAALAVMCLAVAVRTPRRSAAAADIARLSTLGPREIADEQRAARPLWVRLIEPAVGALAARLRPRWAGLAEDDLRRAGIDTERIGVAEVLAVKVLAAVAGAAAVLLLATLAPAAIVL